MLNTIKKSSIVAGMTVFSFVACKGQETKEISMDNEIDKLSYSLGVNIGNNLKQQGFPDVNVDAVATALKDVMSDAETKLTAEEATQALNDYFQKKQEAAQSENEAKGKKFLEENAKKDGIVTLPSGLQYKVLKEGTGAKPGLEDKVTTHYHGTTVDGEVFDSSVDRGEPASFPVGGVIKGWTEALQLMPVGSKWQLFIPSELAYGSRGAGPKIGPNSTLIFDVELLSIDK